MKNENQTQSKHAPEAFNHALLPWRYDAQTRNVIAADGAIVCRNGDSVYGHESVGHAIAEMANSNVEVPVPDSLIAAIDGNLDGMSKSDLVLTCRMLENGRAEWRKECEAHQKWNASLRVNRDELREALQAIFGDCDDFINEVGDVDSLTLVIAIKNAARAALANATESGVSRE